MALGTAPADAGSYTITKIAEANSFGVPAINNGGTVVFGVANNSTGEQAIFTGNGGALTRIADNLGGTYVAFGEPVINTGGSVAFPAGLSTGGGGIFRVGGGQTTTIASTVQAGSSFDTFNSGSLSINAGGTVAFTGEASDQSLGVFTGKGGSITTIASSGATFYGFSSHTSINDAGTVAFSAILASRSSVGAFTGSGAAVTTIFSINNPNTAVLGIPAVNSAGRVAFAAQRDAVLTGIYTGNGGPLTTVVDNTGASGLFLGGLGASLGAVGIDGRGNVVFGAVPKSGGTQGLFSGPDPLADKVIALNDMLDGARVSYLGFGPNGMNEGGQFAFFASLSDGRQEIFRADPASVPEPSSLVLYLIGGVFVVGRFLCATVPTIGQALSSPRQAQSTPHIVLADAENDDSVFGDPDVRFVSSSLDFKN
jgi:hypothetical protein